MSTLSVQTGFVTRSRAAGLLNTTNHASFLLLDGEHFDFLAGVLFNADYTVMRAAFIPRQVTIDRSTFIKRTNSHKFILRDDIWKAPGVRDVTAELQAITF